MATAPVAVDSKKRREMQEIKAPTMFQFGDDDPWIGGILLDISTVNVREKEATQYTIRMEDGKMSTFLGTYEIDRAFKLWSADHAGVLPTGHWINVRYEGEDRSVKTQGNPLRKFRVQVSKEKEPGF